jgi:N-acetylglucosaminyldiphosphoundecaprenol N-acetyl-beta-D-mannosaminyltransferase
MNKKFACTDILGIRVDIVALLELINYALDTIQSEQTAIISYININAVNLAYSNTAFRRFLNDSSIVFCDGFGVKWAIELTKKVIINRFTPPDWFEQFADECANGGYSIYFLGSNQKAVNEAASNLKKKIPNLNICGTHHGFFDKNRNGRENQLVIKEINSLSPDVLVIGFGMPMQEIWISENINDLQTHVVIPVGAFFDYLSGETKRAPRWMTNHGLEWLGRLIVEPNRLWKRYLVGNPLFIWRIIKHHLFRIPLPFSIQQVEK